jgi:glycosyltransferase involved in cell wall biosynthesis
LRKDLRIVYLNPGARLGGAERVLLDLITEVRAARPEWELNLITGEEGPLLERVRVVGAGAEVVPFPGLLARFGDAGAGGPAGNAIGRVEFAGGMIAAGIVSPGYLRTLRGAIRAKSPQLVHTNGFKMHLMGARAAPRSARVVWHLHDYLGMRPLASRLLAMNTTRATLAIANSRSVAEDARVALGGRLRVIPIYNGIDLHGFDSDGPRLDLDALACVPRPESPVVRVGLLATMARWKGHEVFLRALAMLPRDLPVRGYVIGGKIYSTRASETETSELRSVAASFGLNGRVGFTGFVDEPARAIRALDVVVHSSTHPEPFGCVIAEAMACARPVIVSAAGGAVEIVRPGEDALTFEPGDAAALADCIRRLAEDASLRGRLGRAGRAAAVSRFDRVRMAREVISVYEGLEVAAG